MTGPFLRVQEAKVYGPTWVNVARIVKIQRTSNGTSIFLEGASTMQIDEEAELLVGRLEEALVGRMIEPKTTGRSPNGMTRGRRKPADGQHG